MAVNLTAFETAIKTFLDNLAKEDATFAVTYAKENKSIKECCQYIYGEAGKARKGGAMCVALSQEEVYGLAIHYYDEDDIKVANDVIKPSAVQASATPASTSPQAPATEQLAPEEKPKARKPRKPKAPVAETEEDPNIPAPFDMPLF